MSLLIQPQANQLNQISSNPVYNFLLTVAYDLINWIPSSLFSTSCDIVLIILPSFYTDQLQINRTLTSIAYLLQPISGSPYIYSLIKLATSLY